MICINIVEDQYYSQHILSLFDPIYCLLQDIRFDGYLQIQMYSNHRETQKTKLYSKNKQNPINDTVFLMQNQNDILRIKNSQLNNRIQQLKDQVKLSTEGNINKERQIQQLKNRLKSTIFRQDIDLQSEIKLLSEKLILLKSNEQIVLRKIRETREASIAQQGKIASIQNEKRQLEVQALSLKASNEGTRIILNNLENENKNLRIHNEKIVSKRQSNQPRQKQLAIQIQQRIRLIKNQQVNLKNIKKYETTKLIEGIIGLLYLKKLKNHFSTIQNFGLKKKTLKKVVFQLDFIRKKYLNSVKSRALNIFKSSFKPLQQQYAAQRILKNNITKRAKAQIWRKWRRATVLAEAKSLKRFSTQNSFQKISESINKTLLYSSFNMIKYRLNNPLQEKSAIRIKTTIYNLIQRNLANFISSLKQAERKRQLELELEAGSRQQSNLLTVGLYFGAWTRIAKARKIQSKNLKRRYFWELKKLLTLKKRLLLGQMLTITNEKINEVDLQSQLFCSFRKTVIQDKIGNVKDNITALENKENECLQNIELNRNEHNEKYRELSLIKISKHLKKSMQSAFSLWNLRTKQTAGVLRLVNFLATKRGFDVNLGWTRLLRKRFSALKKSIAEKIEGCEFSYNYLLEQNRHIKTVLDEKQHQLQRSKFLDVLLRLHRRNTQLKKTYFFKFMKNGHKAWKFKKVTQRSDEILTNKIKLVFYWIIKQDFLQYQTQAALQKSISEKQYKISLKLLKIAFQSFLANRNKQRQLRRILSGVFNRNAQIDFFRAFGVIRNEEHIHNRSQIQQDHQSLDKEIDNKNAQSLDQQNKIQILIDRLQYKQETLKQRKILTLYKFFCSSIKKKFGGIFNRWHTRAKRQVNAIKFAKIFERKSRVMLEGRFLDILNRQNNDYTLKDLQQKLSKYQQQYDELSTGQQKYISSLEGQSTQMKNENMKFKEEGGALEQQTDKMTNVKLKGFSRSWGKKVVGFYFFAWLRKKNYFVDLWSYLDGYYYRKIVGQVFSIMAKTTKQQSFKARIRQNLNRIYSKKYKWNVGIGFRIWRLTLLNKRVTVWVEQQKKQMVHYELLQSKKNYAIKRHNDQIEFRWWEPRIRNVWNKWRQDAEAEVQATNKGQKLNNWLRKGWSGQFYLLLRDRVIPKIVRKQSVKVYKEKWQNIKLLAFFNGIRFIKQNKKIIQKLFINKLYPFWMNKLNTQVFSLIKYYGFSIQVQQKQKNTTKIQTVISLFERHRKNILSKNMIKWRRNQYEINISKQLLKRITRQAMNWRVKDLFFAWKLQSQAIKVKKTHEEQGQVKKRKIQINRLKLFLQDFKREKGLLLEDQGGQFVVSPRFQQRKQQQMKKDNNLRYKFISRLVLSLNGYEAPVKAYNNLRTYMILRTKCKNFAKMIKNRLRKPDYKYAFDIWRRASQQFNKLFDTMDRKDLIRILNRQKDKMEIQYSKKISLDEKIYDEMQTHKVLAHQEDRKQRLCAHVFLKNYRKVKLYAFLKWRDRVFQQKEQQLNTLDLQGNNHINHLQDEVNELQQTVANLRENNSRLEQAVHEAIEIAQMVKKITQQRDILAKLISEKELTCESLQEENEQLNAKLYLAQKQAMNLLVLSNQPLVD